MSFDNFVCSNNYVNYTFFFKKLSNIEVKCLRSNNNSVFVILIVYYICAWQTWNGVHAFYHFEFIYFAQLFEPIKLNDFRTILFFIFHDLNRIPFLKSLNFISNQTTVKMLRADDECGILVLDLNINIHIEKTWLNYETIEVFVEFCTKKNQSQWKGKSNSKSHVKCPYTKVSTFEI